MRYSPAAPSAIACVVFCLFLAREMVSLSLGCFPGQVWLWRLSYALGYDFLPILTVLRHHLEPSWAPSLILSTLVVMAGVACRSRNRFLSTLAVHLASASVWSCWLFSASRSSTIYATTDASILAWVLAASRPASPTVLTCMSIGLLLICLVTHAEYIRSVMSPRRPLSA
jgi:hypothetical protein